MSISYDTYNSPIRYDSYDTHLCIGQFTNTYNTKLFVQIRYVLYDTYHVLYDTDNYGCVSVNQFSSLTGKKNTGLKQLPLILASLHAESIFHFLSRKRRKYPNTDTTGQVSVFLFFCLLLQHYALDH